MKKNIILFLFSAIALGSCQKEIDWGLGNGSAGQLLVKISSTTGTDSTVIRYLYDAQNRLVGENTTGISAGVSVDNDLTINRNSSGVITTTVQKSPTLLASGIDSVVTRFYYNTANSRYSASAFDLTVGGITVTDSAVYTYDGNGRITSDDHYLTMAPFPVFHAVQDVYTYSGNGLNLVSLAQSATTVPGGPLSPVASQTFTYDSKTNPLLLKNEAIILGRTGFYNANNATQFALDNTVDPAQNFTMDYTYKYNTAGKPDSSYGTRTPGGTVTASKYFYQ